MEKAGDLDCRGLVFDLKPDLPDHVVDLAYALAKLFSELGVRVDALAEINKRKLADREVAVGKVEQDNSPVV